MKPPPRVQLDVLLTVLERYVVALLRAGLTPGAEVVNPEVRAEVTNARSGLLDVLERLDEDCMQALNGLDMTAVEQRFAREDCIRQAWPLFAFQLRSEMSGMPPIAERQA